VREGGFSERKPVTEFGGGWRNVIVDLMIDDVRLEEATARSPSTSRGA
jgi:hypothetical protein